MDELKKDMKETKALIEKMVRPIEKLDQPDECNDLQMEHIKLLEGMKVELGVLKEKIDCVDIIKESIVRLAYIQEKQEERNDKFQKIYEEQIRINAENAFALKNINDNLNALNNKFSGLEGSFILAENKSKIDIRDTMKDIFLKWALPIGTLGGSAFGIYKLIEWLRSL